VALVVAGLIGWLAIELHRRWQANAKIKNPAPPPPDQGRKPRRAAQSRGSEVVPRGDVDLEEGEVPQWRKRFKAVISTGSDQLDGDEAETRIEAADRLSAEVDAGRLSYADAIAQMSASHRLSQHIARRYLQLARKRALAAELGDEAEERDVDE
jgi:hypothetical protein